MESLTDQQRLLLIFVRHGERIDQVKNLTNEEKKINYPKCDPSLT
jgi:hypothetical protein